MAKVKTKSKPVVKAKKKIAPRVIKKTKSKAKIIKSKAKTSSKKTGAKKKITIKAKPKKTIAKAKSVKPAIKSKSKPKIAKPAVRTKKVVVKGKVKKPVKKIVKKAKPVAKKKTSVDRNIKDVAFDIMRSVPVVAPKKEKLPDGKKESFDNVSSEWMKNLLENEATPDKQTLEKMVEMIQACLSEDEQNEDVSFKALFIREEAVNAAIASLDTNDLAECFEQVKQFWRY